MKKQNLDLVWLAGFLDADGCFGMYGNRPLLSISQTDRPVMAAIQKIVGSGRVRKNGITSAGNQVYQIQLGSAETRRVLALVLPYLKRSDKIQKAKFILKWQSLPMGAKESAETKSARLKAYDYYRNGQSCAMVADRLGFKAATVNAWIRKAGLTRSLKEAQELRRQRE